MEYRSRELEILRRLVSKCAGGAGNFQTNNDGKLYCVAPYSASCEHRSLSNQDEPHRYRCHNKVFRV